MSEIKMGDHVNAILGAGGMPRPGVITGVMTGNGFAGPTPQYLVHFDGSEGCSGPCYYAIKIKEKTT